ncbi:ubiquinol--cytochrome-c reductase subunit 8 [Dimargaris verticillata]|uniref:Cytochrome b-c1 complex subunit 8 n=1 Tax=Dimargaris verticillata TaxID=2761393 RepID=A0A9W8B5E6_9FUNG|nr:ubiquinol--cytochrome-c reductase subunit 8 [Dimargaris verticillata]
MGEAVFGNLGGPKQVGIVSYRLSPYEQRAFAGVLKKGFYNVIRRVSAQVMYVAPPALGIFMLYSWAKKRNAYLNTKAGAHEKSD